MKKNLLEEAYPKASEVVKGFKNLKLKGIGSASPMEDRINPSLLEDIESAAENAGIIPTITTAVSGHGKVTDKGGISRHSVGEGVDIAIINGVSVDSNQSSVDNGWKLVRELKKKGYFCSNYPESCDSEIGHPKAIIWQSEGHFNHLHISNTIDGEFDATEKPTSDEPEKETSDVETKAQNIDKILTAIGLEKVSKMDANLDGEDLAHELAKLFGDDNVEVDNDEGVTVFGQKWKDLYSTLKSSLIEQKIHEELNRFKQLIK